jgi:hypothetical protein
VTVPPSTNPARLLEALAADAWLAATTDRPTQRRTVRERRDELSRALCNRAADR